MSGLVEAVARLQQRALSARPSDTSSEPHRLACEVRYALDKPLAERRAYLALVEQRRGAAGAARLREAMAAEWQRRKAAA